MSQSFILVFYLMSICLVNGHSILREPTPWRTRESKNAPCGGGNMPAAANAAVDADTTIAATWEVTAGDGNGPITITVARTDAEAAAFTGGLPTIAVAMNPVPQSGTGTYPFTFNVPANIAAQCAGGTDGKSCHLQMRSTSNWYSCTTLSINSAVVTTAPTPSPTVTAATLPPTPPPTYAQQCVTVGQEAQGTMCQGLIGKSVLVSSTSDVASRIAAAAQDFVAVRNNPLVFRNGQSTECGAYFAQLLCAESLPLCSTTVVNPPTRVQTCQTRCLAAMESCDLDPFHAAAFECAPSTDFPLAFNEQVEDVYGSCTNVVRVSPRPINLKSRLVGYETGNPATSYWVPVPGGGRYMEQVIYAGDILTFRYDPSLSDVQMFASEVHYTNCDFTDATVVASTVVGSFTEATWTTDTAMEGGSTRFFGSSTNGGANCRADPPQKVMVRVVEMPMGAVFVPIASNEPEPIPENQPTQSPPIYIPPPVVDDSAAPNYSLPFATFFCFIALFFNW